MYLQVNARNHAGTLLSMGRTLCKVSPPPLKTGEWKEIQQRGASGGYEVWSLKDAPKLAKFLAFLFRTFVLFLSSRLEVGVR